MPAASGGTGELSAADVGVFGRALLDPLVATGTEAAVRVGARCPLPAAGAIVFGFCDGPQMRACARVSCYLCA